MSDTLAPHFSEYDRELQARYAVTWPHRKLASATRLKPQTVSAIACAINPLTLFRGFQFAGVQGDYRLLSSLSERIGGTFLPPRAPIPTRFTPAMFSQVVTNFGQFLIIAEKVARGVALTDAEMRLLESCSHEIETVVGTVREHARQDRKPHSNEE